MPDTSGYQALGGVKGTAFDSNLPYVDPRKMAAAQENFQRLALMARMQQAQALANQQTRLADRQLGAQERIQGTPERRAAAEGTAQLALQGGSRRELMGDEIEGNLRLANAGAENQLRVQGGTAADLARLGGEQAQALARISGEYGVKGQELASAPGLLDAQRRGAESEQQREFAMRDRRIQDMLDDQLAASMKGPGRAPTEDEIRQNPNLLNAPASTDLSSILGAEGLRDVYRARLGAGPAPTRVQTAAAGAQEQEIMEGITQRQAGKQAAQGRVAEIQAIPVLAAVYKRIRPTVGSDQEAIAAVDAQAGQIVQQRAASLEKDLRRFVAQDAAWFGSDPGAQATDRIAAAVEELQALGTALGDPQAIQNAIREIVQQVLDEESATLGREQATGALLQRLGLGDD